MWHNNPRSPMARLNVLVASLALPQHDSMHSWHFSLFRNMTWCPCGISHSPTAWLDVHMTSIFRGVNKCSHGISWCLSAWFDVPIVSHALLQCDSTSPWHLLFSHGISHFSCSATIGAITNCWSKKKAGDSTWVHHGLPSWRRIVHSWL